MKKPGILVATLLAGTLFLTACSGSRTPSGTNTASADNAATTSDARAVGNSGGSIQASQLEAERVGTGTASGSMVTAAPNPGVTVPLGGNNTSTSAATDQAGQPASTPTNQNWSSGSNTNATGMTTASTPAVTSPMTDPTGKTTGQPSPQTNTNTGQTATTGTTPMGDENWSANRNNPARQSDKMDNNGINADNNTGVGRTTPATMTPPGPPARNVDDTQRMRAAQRRAPERATPGQATQAAPVSASGTDPNQQPTSTSSPTTTAPPMSVQDRERMGRDANNPAGMEQRSMNDNAGSTGRSEQTVTIAADAPIAPAMVSNQAEAIDRITTRLDEIDVALEKKMSARQKSTLLRERKKLMYRLGTLKAVETPASPNPVINSPGGVQN